MYNSRAQFILLSVISWYNKSGSDKYCYQCRDIYFSQITDHNTSQIYILKSGKTVRGYVSEHLSWYEKKLWHTQHNVSVSIYTQLPMYFL